MRKLLLTVAAVCATVVSTPAAAPGNSPDGIVRGPFFSGTIMQKGGKAAAANKGIVVTLGAEKRAYLCYDADTMRAALAWTGDYLEFGKTQERIEWPPPPVIKGQLIFETKVGPGWVPAGDFSDPRPKQQGPLPKSQAHYRGLFVNGDVVVMSYTVGGVGVLETPGLVDAIPGLFTRTVQLDKAAALTLLAADVDAPQTQGQGRGGATVLSVNLPAGKPGEEGRVALAGLVGAPNAELLNQNGRITVKLSGKEPANSPFVIALWTGKASEAAAVQAAIGKLAKPKDLAALTKGGQPLFAEPVVTRGVPGTNESPYVVDTLTEPVFKNNPAAWISPAPPADEEARKKWENPWGAKTYFGGFDFFPDGRAAICTFHGDVWIVSGIDDKLEKLTWRRFATGLFQPLGLKVVDGKVYVLGRDQITRLHDLNGDGAADFYENFNNDTVVTPNYHEFCLDLHTDRAGNFYFAKGAPWTPDVQSPHQGTIIKVSKDGAKMEVIATGLRAPNGMGMGPKDELTVSDNQGHWMPSSKLNWVTPGGFYGMMPAAQRELTLRRADGSELKANPSDPEVRKAQTIAGWDKTAPIPTGYDQPMLWFPMSMDNSSGGQEWVTTDKWGPFKNHLLFMSYGKGTIFHVMHETVDGVVQAAAWQFPLKFNSGTMRARVNPKDGQLYTCGLRGWQTGGVRDGAFQRVRHTGQPVHAPLDFHVKKEGVAITFTTTLDASLASDPASYSIEQWNYIYSGGYGSPEVSCDDAAKKGRDKVEVKSAKLGADKKTVLLEFAVKPANQVRIKFNLKSADGAAISQELYSTIHKVPAK